MHQSLAMLAYYIHDLDPYVFKIGPWGPRWYGLAYLMGFLFAYLLLKKNAHDGMLRLNPERVADLVLNGCIFGVLLGGRLGYCIFYQPSLLGFTGEFPYWGVLRVWEGGMSAHGGVVFTIMTLMVFGWQYLGQPTRRQLTTLVGGAFVCGAIGWMLAYFIWNNQYYEVGAAQVLGMAWMVFYGWWNAIPVINIGDAACMVVPIGLFFGRCANFINGELYGHPTTVPWAVKFPSEIYAPTNGTIDPGVYDRLLGLFATLGIPVNWSSQDPIGHSVDMLHRRLLEHNPQALTAVANIIPARHPSQLYEALLEGLLLFVICWTIGRKWRKDGMASGAFLTFYPIMRIIGEQFRVGDTPALIFGMEISKGVLYSIPMVLGGALYWGYCIKRNKPNVWQPPPPAAKETPDKSAKPA